MCRRRLVVANLHEITGRLDFRRLLTRRRGYFLYLLVLQPARLLTSDDIEATASLTANIPAPAELLAGNLSLR